MELEQIATLCQHSFLLPPCFLVQEPALCFLLPQPLHQNLSSFLGHFCALLDYLFLLFEQFFFLGWSEICKYLCFCTCCKITASCLHPCFLLKLNVYRINLLVIIYDLLTFGTL